MQPFPRGSDPCGRTSTSDRHILADFFLKKTRPAYWYDIEGDVIINKLTFYESNLQR